MKLPIEKYNENSLREIFKISDENSLPETPPNYPPYYSWHSVDGINPDKVLKFWKQSNKINKDRIPTIYTHLPFCQYICKFCGFYRKIPYSFREIDLYLKALNKEAIFYSSSFKKIPIRNLCFGGGTPTMLSYENLNYLFKIFYENYTITAETRIAIEASPQTLTYEKALMLKKLGVNYLSIGIQSFNEKLMRSLGRPQKTQECIQALKNAKKAGIENVEADLIVGLPGQTEEIFMKDIDILSEFDLERVYIFDWQPRNFITYADMKSASLYGIKMNMVRNWRRKGIEKLIKRQNYIMRCGHWIFKRRGEEWPYTYDQQEEEGYSILGLGATSITYCADRQRYQNFSDVKKYMQALDKNKLPISNIYFLNKEEEMINYIIVKFLHIGQLVISHFKEKYGKDPADFFKQEFNYLISQGLIRKTFDSYFLTDRSKAVFYLRGVFYREKVLDLISEKSKIKIEKIKNTNLRNVEFLRSSIVFIDKNSYKKNTFEIKNKLSCEKRSYKDIFKEIILRKKIGFEKIVFFSESFFDEEIILLILNFLKKIDLKSAVFISKKFLINQNIKYKISDFNNCEFVPIIDEKSAFDYEKVKVFSMLNITLKPMVVFSNHYSFIEHIYEITKKDIDGLYIYVPEDKNVMCNYNFIKENAEKFFNIFKKTGKKLKFINMPYCFLYPFQDSLCDNFFKVAGDSRENNSNTVKIEACMTCNYLLYCPGPSYGYLNYLDKANPDKREVLYYSVKNSQFFGIKAIKS